MKSVVLAIDYGTKRIGVAISQGSLAEPLCILEQENEGLSTDQALDEAISNLAALCATHNVTQLVIGLSENKMADLTKKFAEKLQQKVDLPIDFIDETLSSYEMHLKLRQTKRKKKQGPIDHFVAAQLLQEWLDEKGVLTNG